MVLAKTFILNKPFSGPPVEDNFKLVEEQLGELKNGGEQLHFSCWKQKLHVN